jgi:hypothetical protein
MAEVGETDEDVLARIREQGTAFEHQTDLRDDKLNDGNNYRGLMQNAEYKQRRIEVLEDQTEREAAKRREAVSSALNADRAARDDEKRQREEREAARREKLRRQMEAEQADGAEDAAEGAKEEGAKKKKKRKAPSSTGALSFDADE